MESRAVSEEKENKEGIVIEEIMPNDEKKESIALHITMGSSVTLLRFGRNPGQKVSNLYLGLV